MQCKVLNMVFLLFPFSYLISICFLVKSDYDTINNYTVTITRKEGIVFVKY